MARLQFTVLPLLETQWRLASQHGRNRRAEKFRAELSPAWRPAPGKFPELGLLAQRAPVPESSHIKGGTALRNDLVPPSSGGDEVQRGEAARLEGRAGLWCRWRLDPVSAAPSSPSNFVAWKRGPGGKCPSKEVKKTSSSRCNSHTILTHLSTYVNGKIQKV